MAHLRKLIIDGQEAEVNEYVSGDNVAFTRKPNGTYEISATDTTYAAGTGISITGANNAINAERHAGNTYTIDEIDALLGNLEHARMEEVQALPATGESNIIYLVPNAQAGGHDMYIWDGVNNNFVPIGHDTVDLTNYSTKSQTVSNITRSGTTFTATRADGTTFTFTQKDSDPLIAPEEYSPARSPHAVGEYFVYNGSLWRVTSAIAVGDVLNYPSNVTPTKVGDALTALSTRIEGLILTEWKGTTSSLTIAAGAKVTPEMSIAKAGYTPLGIIGFYKEGQDNADVVVSQLYIDSRQVVCLALKNTATAARTLTSRNFGILYKKNA